MDVLVVPADVTPEMQELASAAGLRASPAPDDHRGVVGAMDLVQSGSPVLYVPEGASAASALERIVVVHEGRRGDRAGMDAADAIAVATRAEVIVLHVPASRRSPADGSLPFRVADRGAEDWAEWREEFLRRFCRCTPGVDVKLHVALGRTEAIRARIADERPDLIVLSGGGSSRLDKAATAALTGPAPVLIVPSLGRVV